MTGSDTGSDSGENAGSIGSVSVPDPTENLPDPTEKLDQTTPDTKASTFSGDADPALTNAFWRLVLAVDVGFISLSLGVMLIWFRGNWGGGGRLVTAGGVVLLYAGYRYIALRRRINAGEFDDHGNN